MKKIITILFFTFICMNVALSKPVKTKKILTGAQQTSSYIFLLKNKKVGVFVNHSSVVGSKHLITILKKNKITITKIFVPEHGFAGVAEDGEKIKNAVDKKTGIPIVSLYGKKTKPSSDDLKNVDVLLFDIQDVGVRFYTYISSLQRLMEAAVEQHKPLIILDRPNPNGFYVDGPVPKTKSFTGLQPIPIVYGMTMGEYAKMLVGEEWLDVKPKSKAKSLRLTIIRNANYTHKSLYQPPLPPSPNLPNIKSIYWYPSIGMLEGTVISVGRGTNKPFQVFGHPKISAAYTFIPRARVGAENPLYMNQVCHGWNIGGTNKEILKKINHKLQIKYYMQAYKAFPDKRKFFPGSHFKNEKNKNNKSSDNLGAQIARGMSEKEIRASWEPRLSEFKKIRKKYLLYPDFSRVD